MTCRSEMITILNTLLKEQGQTHRNRLLTDEKLMKNLLADYARRVITEKPLHVIPEKPPRITI